MTPDLSSDDARALERYRYLLRTAPPEAIEQEHAQAIARLTPEQRQMLLRQVGEMLPPYERALAGPANATPQGIARLITRAEMQQPGRAERMFGAVPAVGGGVGFGSALGASLLGSVVGVVLGSVLAQSLFSTDEAANGASSGAAETDPGGLADLGGEGDIDLGGLFDV